MTPEENAIGLADFEAALKRLNGALYARLPGHAAQLDQLLQRLKQI